MKKKLLSFIFIFIALSTSFSQEKRSLLIGTVFNTVSVPIKDAHIINLTTNKGTITDTFGKFTLLVKTGDWIQISNIQFITKKIRLKKGTVKERKLRIHLIPVTNVLEEAVLEKKLKGDLSSDLLKNKTDSIQDQVNSILSYIKNIPHKEIMKMKTGADERHMKKPKDAQLTTDPIAKVAGLPPKTIGIPDYALLAKRALKKELNFKERFPFELLNLFGPKFFFEKLKIPKDRYFHFLQYCNPKGITGLFKEKKHLEILKILLKQSKSYLLLIENNK